MYNFTEIEKKWQKYWQDHQTFAAKNDDPKEKYYLLVEFPYPSGAGLHRMYPLNDSVWKILLKIEYRSIKYSE